MPNWRGHHPTIKAALLQILDRAASDAVGLRRGERVLYTAAEFWAAVRARELASFLEAGPELHLLAAEVAFAEIGAVRVGNKLRAALDRLRAAPFSQKRLREIARNLERELIATDDPVDWLLAGLAAECEGNASVLQ